MNKAILSTRYPQFAERLAEYGYRIIPSESIPCRMTYERDHADLQCIVIDKTAFILHSCTRLINELDNDYRVVSCGRSFDGDYPNNVCLSAVKIKSHMICRVPSLDEKLREYAEEHGYSLIHVNQGYTKCSCAIVSDIAVITADHGVYNSLSELNYDALLIRQGRVRLDGAEYGFIGGASGYDKDAHTLYFCGNINRHPDFEKITEFCEKHGTKIVSLTDGELIDIGGIIFC